MAPTSLGTPLAAASDAGLAVLSAASWPEADADDEVPEQSAAEAGGLRENDHPEDIEVFSYTQKSSG